MAVKTPDQVWADFDGAGRPLEPVKQEIRILINYIMTLAQAAGVGARTYATKAAMDADAAPVGTLGLVYRDPVEANNFPTLWIRNGATNAWEKGVDRVELLSGQLASSNRLIAGLRADVEQVYRATAVPAVVRMDDPIDAEPILLTGLSNPSTRATVTTDSNGYHVTGLPALGTFWPFGARLKTPLIRGRTYYVEAKYTAGTMDSNTGFWFGTDAAVSGDMSTAARMVVYRNGVLVPCTSNGISGDATRTVTPAYAVADPIPATGSTIGFQFDVLNDLSLRVRVFVNNKQVPIGDLIISPAAPNGSIVVGCNIKDGYSADIKVVEVTEPTRNTLYVDNNAGLGGSGLAGSPLKTLLEVPDAIQRLGLRGDITIQLLSDDVYGYLQLKESIAKRWRVVGKPGGKTRILGLIGGDVFTWSPVAGTNGEVFSTPSKIGDRLQSAVNQPFVLNRPENPRPWYQLAHTMLELVPIAGGPTDLVGKTAGAFGAGNSQIYIRLPDGLNPDPAANPSNPVALSRCPRLIELIGAPHVELINIIGMWASDHGFVGGSGTGTIVGCGMEWTGSGSNGWEEWNGQFVYIDTYVDNYGNDGVGRTPRPTPASSGVLTTTLIGCRISRSRRGDAISQHFLPAAKNVNRLIAHDCRIFDVYKNGIVTTAHFIGSGNIIERSGDEQFAIIMPGHIDYSNPGAGILNNQVLVASLAGSRLDPGGVGGACVWVLGQDGARVRLDLDGVYLGVPAPGLPEVRITKTTIAGYATVPNDNLIRYYGCKTARPRASVQLLDSQSGAQVGIHQINPAYDLTP